MSGRSDSRLHRARLKALAVTLGLGLALALYGVAEAAFRYHRYREVSRVPWLPRVRFLSRPYLAFDREIGFRYVPGEPVRQTIVDEHNRVEHRNTIRINAAGHVSHREYPTARDAREYRIAVIGDSFTACTFNDLPWPDLLEDRLQGDAELLTALDRSRIRVLNFGLDGTGFAQWGAVYAHEVSRYGPDLVVVAFIENDIWREFRWMDIVPLAEGSDTGIVLITSSLPASLDNPRAQLARQLVVSEATLADPERRARDVRRTVERRIAALPWFGFHAELLASRLDQAGVPLPPALMPRLKYAPEGPRPWMVERGLDLAVERIRALRSQVAFVLLHLPTRQELDASGAAPLVGRLRSQLGEITWTTALEPLLAVRARQPGVSWFVPNNSHPSDAGAHAYAEAIHVALRPYLVARRSSAGSAAASWGVKRVTPWPSTARSASRLKRPAVARSRS
jgi:hypothetical protein